MRVTPKQLSGACAALSDALRFEHPADGVLSAYFREQKVLGARDRAFIAETVYAVLRRKRSLSRVIGQPVTPRRLILAQLVRHAGLSQRALEGLLETGEADWLTRLKSEPEPELSLAEQADLPDWLVDMLTPHMSGDKLLELARSLNTGAPLDLRVNPLKASRDAVLEQLKADGYEGEAGKISPLSIRLRSKPALTRYALYQQGQIEVQDEGSQLLAYLVAPKRGEMVVDFCAGAGGKTLLLGALMRSTGRLYAFDVSEKRLARLRPRVARAGLSNVHPVCISSENDVRVKRLAGKIDRVLVDAPCSGLGTLRRNPDLKWRQTAEGVAELVRKQQDILSGAARLVKPGGRLVYATCSILPQENEEVVAAFLAAHEDFRQIPATRVLGQQQIALDTGDALRLSPQQHDTDGFYAVVLERRK
jgi:16S rRNA (cytosine967-C5)-methyltransferase